ncbi:hypothetical protein IQ266_03825 [filamentous cyanobacterium LEGE 11480]|uniref:Tetratricopeptide repeat protein n=1 Tax=Romeriopsis navalis LEGE 11480 TaxID=2777977 RepID=A0A928VMW3_9CYAN|nr:hypothetical protein [Romeriopsis navalis]MBE9028889.1 hypothetical protein [Romeriopsis navalis LEGE 11480]
MLSKVVLQQLSQVSFPTPADFDQLRSLQAEFPDSPELWNFRGNWLQLYDVPLAQVQVCYEKAISCDPTFAAGHESLGYYHDTFGDDLMRAMQCFRQALKLGAGDASHIGLARVLAQLGRSTEAIQQLNQCVDQANTEVVLLRCQIADGLWAIDD